MRRYERVSATSRPGCLILTTPCTLRTVEFGLGLTSASPCFWWRLFGIDGQSARALHKHYYSRHGTTLSGLVLEHLDLTERFLDFVHDIDRSSLKPDPVLAREIGRLPGRKLIFTNGSRSHAILTARQLGLEGLFEDPFDIVAAGLTPKPSEGAYDLFFDQCRVNPRAAAMFEDVARNLAVPKAKGMTTTLVTTKVGSLDHREAHDQSTLECRGGRGFRDR